MAYRLLAIDLDGTLLNSSGTVGERTIAALRRAAAEGIVIAPATARWYQAAVRPFAAMSIEVAAIASAGADVRGPGGNVVQQDHLPQDFARFVAELCDRAGWPATLAVPGKAYRRANELPPWAANAPEWLQPVTSLGDVDLSELLAVLAEPDEGDPRMHELLAWDDRVSIYNAVSFAGDGMVTVTARGVDKGTGLLALCHALGIPPAEAVAFGDSEVDLPMMRAAGLAIAVANATGEVKAAADIVIPGPDADGVGEWLETVMLES